MCSPFYAGQTRRSAPTIQHLKAGSLFFVGFPIKLIARRSQPSLDLFFLWRSWINFIILYGMEYGLAPCSQSTSFYFFIPSWIDGCYYGRELFFSKQEFLLGAVWKIVINKSVIRRDLIKST